MRTVFSIIVISVLLWGCSKKDEVKPTDTNKTPIPPITTKPDTTKKFTKDDSIHMAAFIIYPQKVKTSVSGKTLTLAFDENVSLFLLADGYNKTSAIHLNNVKFKTISDTTINNVKVVKVNVHRMFTFSKAYSSSQLAIDQQNLILGKTDDVLTFSSYTYYNKKTYPVTSAVAYLKYVK